MVLTCFNAFITNLSRLFLRERLDNCWVSTTDLMNTGFYLLLLFKLTFTTLLTPCTWIFAVILLSSGHVIHMYCADRAILCYRGGDATMGVTGVDAVKKTIDWM